MDLDNATVEREIARLEKSLRPVILGQKCQGDIIVDPTGEDMPWWCQPKRHAAVITLIAEGNGHRLRVDLTGGGVVLWTPRIVLTDLGLLDITPGGVVWLEQVQGSDPHQPMRIDPGRYLVGRQRIATSPPLWWMHRPHITFRRK